MHGQLTTTSGLMYFNGDYEDASELRSSPFNVIGNVRVFLRQVGVLVLKNVKLLWRNKAATLLQTCIGLLFIALLFGLQTGLNANSARSSKFLDSRDLPSQKMAPFPDCRHGMLLNRWLRRISNGICMNRPYAESMLRALCLTRMPVSRRTHISRAPYSFCV